MKPPLPSKISVGNFRKAIAGSKGFVSGRQYEALKKAGLGSLQYEAKSKSISKDRASRALKILRESGELGSKTGSTIWDKAAGLEREQIMKKEALKQTNLKTFLAMDVADQMAFEEMHENIYTKRTFSSVAERAEYEKKMREKKIAEAEGKRSKMINAKVNPQAPKMIDLPDMNIG